MAREERNIIGYTVALISEFALRKMFEQRIPEKSEEAKKAIS